VTAVEDADIVITATTSDTPLVEQRAISDRALVCAIGSTKPQRCETDPELFRRAGAVVTDSVHGAPDECGDLIHAAAAGTFDWDDLIDLADVLAGKVDVARAGDAGPVVFETQGIALQDVVAAALVWRAASSDRGRTSA
jgi:ornithine cyclodeaminase/alanine dehydrogenase-like protein (mu-crystallin family)